MFRIITVEREYGAGGSLVAAELAHRRGWQLLDQQLTGDIAKMAAQVPALFETLSGMDVRELLGKVRQIGDKAEKPPANGGKN